ncbi:cytochrome P450, partial [Pseudonocardia nigra]|uniref:cytochrome P450 n=1 Tax=Pseudonocardia nigra TaxID=1921578 RepID=UPI001C5DFC4F
PRALAFAELDRIPPDDLRRRAAECGGHPVAVLAAALGLPVDPADVATVAGVYHPHTPAPRAADAAVARLVAACGGTSDERTAARIGLLVQACDATSALVRSARDRGSEVHDVLRDDPPVRVTRRGDALVDLASAGLPFGAGAHACPGREHALALAEGLLRHGEVR